MFRLIALPVLLLDLMVWRSVYRQLSQRYPERARALVWGMGVAFLVLFHPAVLMTVASWSALRSLRTALPDWLLMAGMGVQFAVLLGLLLRGLLLGGSKLVGAYHGLRRSFQGRREPVVAPPELSPASPERRTFVQGAAAMVPMVALGISTGGVVASRQRPVVTRVRLPVRRELTALHGVTIAQVSDVHVGSYMDAERLDEIRDAVNALGADFHVITGDLLDNHVSQLELATRFIRGLAPGRGEVFFGMGNHEYIAARSADVRTIVQGLEDAGAQVLVDEARRIRIGGDHLWMSGLDYPPSRRYLRPEQRTTAEGMARILGQVREDGAPRILLSHHPRTFVEVREQPIDLTLSGHTHGGQLKLGRIGDYAITPILPVDFYHNGLYDHAGRKLYVNSGAGGWFPVRINCPPEITLVELVPA